MNKQEIFDKVWAGLSSQGWAKSMMRPGSQACAYRGALGRKCAVGWLIPDQEYDPIMEGLPISWFLVERAEGRSRAMAFLKAIEAGGVDLSEPGVLDLLESMQHAHDSLGNLKESMVQVAQHYNLTIPPDSESKD